MRVMHVYCVIFKSIDNRQYTKRSWQQLFCLEQILEIILLNPLICNLCRVNFLLGASCDHFSSDLLQPLTSEQLNCAISRKM